MKMPSFFSKRLLILLLPLLSVMVSGLILWRGDEGLPRARAMAVEASMPPASPPPIAAPSPGREITDRTSSASGGPETGEKRRGAVVGPPTMPAPQVPVPPAVRSWTLQVDAVPVAHWAPGTQGPAPQRSGRLAGGLESLEKAVAGTPVEFPLFDGLTAQGTADRTAKAPTRTAAAGDGEVFGDAEIAARSC